MEKLIAVIGPTAVGKTKISIELAELLHTEIISGDSMLVYQNMDIGTAKPDMIERSGIPHHLIDILTPHQEFNVVDFLEQAKQKITDINRQGKIPILAGGTGLYVKALLEGYNFSTTSSNENLRQKYLALADKYGNVYVHDLLHKVDPDTAQRLHPNDLRRIIRALEVYHTSGERISQNKLGDEHELLYDAIVIGLMMDRQTLYNRINQRVDLMMNQGLVQEVASLLAGGVSPQAQSMKGIGYKEIVAYLEGKTDLATATDNIKKATRHFAKRQITWYKKMPYIEWFEVDKIPADKIMSYIYKHVAGKFYQK